MKKFICYCFIVTLLIIMPPKLHAQNDSISTLKVLDRLISNKEFVKADSLISLQEKTLRDKKSYYQLTDYIYYKGRITLELNGKEAAIANIESFAKSITDETDSLKVSRQKYLELSTFYEYLGNNNKALELNLKALEETKKWKNATPDYLGIINNNIGIYYTRSGNLDQAVKYTQEALKQYESYPETEPVRIFNVHNSLGGMMWYRSKMDSALYYYNNALKVYPKLEKTPINQYYRPSFLQNNIAGIYGIQGNISEAKKAMEGMISNLGKFINSDVQDSKKEDARIFMFQGIENYAGLFKDQGNFKKAEELIKYAYDQKVKYLGKESSEVANSKVLLGQIHLAQRNHELAEVYLDEAIKMYSNYEGDFNTWLADAYYYKGSVNAEQKNIDVAKSCYEKSETYYKIALGNYYDELYLDFVVNASNFYSKNGFKEKALEMATNAYDYVVKNQGEKTLLEYYQAVNLADIYYNSKDYNEALKKSNRAVQILEDPFFSKTNELNALQVSFQKPLALLVKSKTEFQLNKNKDSDFLKNIFKNLKEAINILESQKSVITEDQNVSILIEDNNELFEFSKKIALQRFKKTGELNYLKDILSLHESKLYNRIRNRLNSQSTIAFGNIPEDILDKEKELKRILNSSLNNENAFESFLKADTDWKEFLKVLSQEYPKYFELRYASISKSFDSIISNIKANQTLIRYVFIEKKLYAFLISKDSLKMFELDSINLTKMLTTLENNQKELEDNYKTYNDLYNTLWKPFENEAIEEDVIIFPDGVLFNLSFETLVNTAVNSMQEFTQKCLLAKHNISYNYSLFLLENGSKTIGYKDNFVAFAPEFSDQMKTDYKLTITDSVTIDKTYLSLLSQPFSVDLAKDYSKEFNGKSFLNNNASKQVFTKHANEHKIIHIGTHAESNNISPELSRLVFAKNESNSDNSLFTYEIYNQNLSSNLAVLTACETGKPTYKSGEGMISLAHAFNYAGSESILTSLWKIDEQSSTKIIKLFYNNISKGLSKNESLKLAKLSYIKTAEGRAKLPQYWAGLVLIGDTSPIDIRASSNMVFWLIGILTIILIAIFFKRKRNTKKAANTIDSSSPN